MSEFDLELRSLLRSKADAIVVQGGMPSELPRRINMRRARYAVTAVAVVAVLGAAALSASALLSPEETPNRPAGPAPSEPPDDASAEETDPILASLAGTYETDVSEREIDAAIAAVEASGQPTTEGSLYTIERFHWAKGHWTITIEPDGGVTFSNPKFDRRVPEGQELKPGTLRAMEGRSVRLMVQFYDDDLCRVGATYRWTQRNGSLHLEVVDDECPARIAVMTSRPWTVGS